MKKRRWKILLLVILAPIALAALGLLALAAYVELTRPPDEWGWLEEYSVEQEFFTAKEAYALVLPLTHRWHEDSIITSVWAGNLWSELPEWEVQPDGRNGMWHFTACSRSAGKWVSVMVVRGSVGLGVYDKPWGYLDDDAGCRTPLPIDALVDSDAAILTARCLAGNLIPTDAYFVSYNQYTRETIPYSWLIGFSPPQGGTLRIYIDGRSGRPIEAIRDAEEIVPLDHLPPC